MAKAKTAKATAAKPAPAATEAAGKPAGGMVAKIKDFGKNAGEKAKAAGMKAASHVSRNRAAYIAGGLGAAAGAGGMAILKRNKQAQSED